MKKTAQTTIDEIRNHVKENPSSPYRQVAALYEVSEITVKRVCADLGRGKNWRRGRQQQPDHDKFWSAVDRSTNGCWEWRGSLNNSGYGFVYFDGRNQAAHRVAYALTNGPIADGLELDHACRNRACCNPDHLEPVSHAVNMERVRSAAATHEEFGQRYSAAQSIAQSTSRLMSFNDLLARPFREGKEREAEDSRWGLTLKELGPRETWPHKVRSFTITSSLREDGIRVVLPARSAKFAREMFESAWGYEGKSVYTFGINIEETGKFKDADSTARAMSGWRGHLQQKYRIWMETVEGRRCIGRLETAMRERWYEERLDEVWLEQQQLQEEAWARDTKRAALKKKESGARRSRQLCSGCRQLPDLHCSNCGGPLERGGQSWGEYEEFEKREAYPDEAYLEEWESSE